MPIATNLVATLQNGNKTKTQNIPYGNPNAEDSDLATFAAALFNLSQNTLVNVKRVNAHDISLPVTTKPTPTLTFTKVGNDYEFDATNLAMTCEFGMDGTTYYIGFTREGNGAVTVGAEFLSGSSASYNSSTNQIELATGSTGRTVSDRQATVTVTVAESDDYASATATINITYSVTDSSDQP